MRAEILFVHRVEGTSALVLVAFERLGVRHKALALVRPPEPGAGFLRVRSEIAFEVLPPCFIAYVGGDAADRLEIMPNGSLLALSEEEYLKLTPVFEEAFYSMGEV